MTESNVNGRTPILVTGATGSTGQSLWHALARRAVPARAMIRKPADVNRFTGPLTDAVVADFDDGASVANALTGIDRAYLVTPSSERAEAQQLHFVEAAARAGVRHVAVLSQLGAREDSPVRYLRYHAAVENRVRELGIGHTFLRPNLYFQGLLAFGPSIARDGTFGAPIGDARVSAIDVFDIGEVAASVLAATTPEDVSPEDNTLTLTGPQALTHAEMADSLSDALGRRVTFTDVPAEAFAAVLQEVLPPWQVGGTVEDYAHYRRGEAEAVSSAVQDVTGRRPRTFDEFVRDNITAFAPNAG